MNVQVDKEEREFKVTRYVPVLRVTLTAQEIEEIVVGHLKRTTVIEQGLRDIEVAEFKFTADTGYSGEFYGADVELVFDDRN